MAEQTDMATDGQPSFAAPPLSTSAVEISKGAAAFQKIALLLGDQVRSSRYAWCLWLLMSCSGRM